MCPFRSENLQGSNNWVGLIPAAGKGLRLGLPYPKELYPIIHNNHYKPISQYIVDQFIYAGIEHIIFVINETKHQLIGFFGSGEKFGCHFSYVFQENPVDNLSRSPGLAKALDSAYHLIRGQNVMFGMPDTIIIPPDCFSQASQGFEENIDILLCLFPTSTPNKFGMVRTNRSGNVLEIVDKPTETDLHYMWGGILWGPNFTELLHIAINEQGIEDFAAILNLAVKRSLVIKTNYFDEAEYIDLGTYDEIVALDKKLRVID